ncbi:MAG TPA: gliding motility-associated C-terminal domain-containing protein, partial [Bacteroidia bacterium]|nr:gliding motility-associated C-terminal domain-containing protein [Bacteroidia bacterium]
AITQTITGLAAGVYTVTITDANGCSVTKTDTVQTSGLPPVTSAITGTTPVCPGAVGIIYSVTNNPGSTFTWTVPAGATLTSGQGTNSITVTFGATGGTISCTQTNVCGTAPAVTFNVTTSPTPITSAITGTSPVCPGATGIVYSVANTPGSTYNWTVPAGATITSGQGTNSITVTFGASGGTVSCTETSTCGSGAPVTFNVTTSPTPVTSAITGTSPVCTGTTGVVYSVTNTPGSTYNWTVPPGSTITSGQGTNSITVTLGSTSGTVTCTETSSCGTGTPVTFPVTVSTIPVTSAISGTNPVCPGATGIVYSVTNVAGSTYNWIVPPGATITSGQGTNSVTVTFGASGGIITCTQNSTCGNSAPVSMNITMTPNPVTSAITGISPLCPHASGIVFSVTNTPGSTYAWTVPGGASITSGQGTNSITVTFGTSGGSVTVTESNTCGSGAPVTFNVTMGSNPTTSAITGPLSICASATGQIFSVTNTSGSTYTWTVPAGSTIVAGQGSNSITVNCGTTGGTVTCTETNACGSDMVSSTFTILPLPVAAITGNSTLCSGDSLLLAASGGGTYSWNTGATSSSIHVTAGGTYSVTVSNGCGSSTATAAVVVSTVVSNFTTDSVTGYVPFTVHFTNNSSSNVTGWSWNFGDGTTGTGPNPIHVYGTAGTYTAVLTVTDPNGCTSTFNVLIHVNDVQSSLNVPNVFTPNSDGSNDVFLVEAKGIATFEMKIYDRWGILMNTFTNPSQGWDGRTQGGVAVTNGTYYYILNATGSDGKIFNKQGYLMLIR